MAAMLVGAGPASAVTAYCQDQVQPVTLSVTWNASYTQVAAKTSAPINSTAKLYVKLPGETAFHYVGYAHDSAGSYATIYYVTQSPANYVILNYGDSGQTWYGPGGGTLAYCRSPIRTTL